MFKPGELVTTKRGEFPFNTEHGRIGIVTGDRNTFGAASVIDVYWLHSKRTLAYLPGALIRINPQEAQNEV
jgi:spore germination protein GerM